MSLRSILIATILFGVATAASANVDAGFEFGAPSPCVSPCAVYVDAIGDPGSPHTNASDSGAREFHDVEFSWNFGDSSAGTWRTTGNSKNRAHGPQAAHVYEIEDGSGDTSFTITVEATGSDGSTDTATKTIRVVDPASQPTVCISRTNDVTGCPSNAARIRQSDGSWASIINKELAAGRKRILFRRGQTWPSQDRLDLNFNGPVTIGAFGPSGDERPTISVSADSAMRASDGRDIRIVDFIFDGPGGKPRSMVVDGWDATSNILLLRTKAVPNSWARGSSLSNPSGLHRRYFLVDSEWVGFTNAKAHYGSTAELVILGSNLGKTPESHTIRLVHTDGAVISNSIIHDEGDRKATLTIRAHDGKTTRNVVITDNIIRGKGGEFFSFVSKNKSIHTVHGLDFLVDGNLVTRTASGSDFGVRTGIKCSSTDHVTIRNNMIQMDNWNDNRLGIRTSCNDVRAYNNRCYSNTNGSRAICVDVQGGQNVRVRDNVLYAPKVSDARVVREDAGSVVRSSNVLAGSNPFVASTPRTVEGFRLKESDEGGGGSVALEPPFLH